MTILSDTTRPSFGLRTEHTFGTQHSVMKVSFIPSINDGMMWVVEFDLFARHASEMTVSAARERYAALSAKGATKCRPHDTFISKNEFGQFVF